jgi:hypothetical protein
VYAQRLSLDINGLAGWITCFLATELFFFSPQTVHGLKRAHEPDVRPKRESKKIREEEEEEEQVVVVVVTVVV